MDDYASMEQCTVKYSQYELAICAALEHLRPPAARAMAAEHQRVRILVVGAGRAPLVKRCLAAAARVRVLVDVLALERNEEAIEYCRRSTDFSSASLGDNKVQFLHADAVDAQHAIQTQAPGWSGAELVVSELLGSFADNELAPEVLSVVALASGLLSPRCQFIPQSHTSFVYPVQSPFVQRVLKQRGSNRVLKKRYGSPWVLGPSTIPQVRPVRPECEPRAAIRFCYQPGAVVGPSSTATSQATASSAGEQGLAAVDVDVRSQASELLEWQLDTFVGSENVCIDGLCGVFDCVLYGAITLSSVPGRETPGLTEWSPMLFPVKPVLLRDGRRGTCHPWTIHARIARVVEPHRVYYTWHVRAVEANKSVSGEQIRNSDGQHSSMKRLADNTDAAAAAC